ILSDSLEFPHFAEHSSSKLELSSVLFRSDYSLVGGCGGRDRLSDSEGAAMGCAALEHGARVPRRVVAESVLDAGAQPRETGHDREIRDHLQPEAPRAAGYGLRLPYARPPRR